MKCTNEAIRRAIRWAVTECGTITQAAQAMGMTQPTFSRKLNSDASFSLVELWKLSGYTQKTPDEIYAKALEYAKDIGAA